MLRQRAVDALGSDAVLRLHVLLPPRFKRSPASMVNPLQIALRDICGVKINIDMANELWKMRVRAYHLAARAARAWLRVAPLRRCALTRVPRLPPCSAGLTRSRRTSRSAAS